MIHLIIAWSIKNRLLVVMLSMLLAAGGFYSLRTIPVDAIPDLSDTQVIIKTAYPGQAPQVVEDQVTYPISSAMLSVPGATSVRGFSFFGDSYVYVLFDDKTDIYWARSRVLEYLSQIQSRLPAVSKPTLGPDASGVGWVYIYALVDRTGQHDLHQLRSLQDWFLKYELQALPGISEVATVGGMVKQYQVEVNPQKLRAYNIPLEHVELAIKRGNGEAGASVIEMAEAEYRIRVLGYLNSVETISSIPLGVNNSGTPIQIKHIATVSEVPAMRRVVTDLDGQGEATGAIVVMRKGENARQTISAVKKKLHHLKASLPEGVEIVPVYDRSSLIDQSVKNLWHKIVQELLLVALVCMVFLLHLRSALVALVCLPMGVLLAFLVMRWQGVNANIMSLGGIAIALGAMIDGAMVMVDALHKKIQQKKQNQDVSRQQYWQWVTETAQEVGPAIFFSLLVITVSFMPVFALQAQEGKLFSPLAYTKTYAMAAAAALSVTLIPVLMGYFIGHRTPDESSNKFISWLGNGYRYLLLSLLKKPLLGLLITLLLLLSTLWPLSQLGSEFMPELDEGDLMYMPTTYPAISLSKVREVLQQSHKLIATHPEVARVFGKAGRAETATDPAPLTMIESFIQLKPKTQWRDGVTLDQIKRELDQRVKIPGVSNAWVMPIKTRIDMLATGIKTPVGIKISGHDFATIEQLGKELESLIAPLTGTASVYAERVSGGRYINIDIDRDKAARFALNIADIQQILSSAVGGVEVGQTIEGVERYPINLRYPQYYRDSPEQLMQLPLVTPSGAVIALGDVASVRLDDGPAMIKSENARLSGWVFVDVNAGDIGRYVDTAQHVVASQIKLPAGYTLEWRGQYEYLQRAKESLSLIVPITVMVIVLLLYMNFRSLPQVVILLATLPVALSGSLWLLHVLSFNFSVAVAVGMIALAGVAIETAVIMMLYLDRAWQSLNIHLLTESQLKEAISNAAVSRIRPLLMTAVATIAGLLPILFGQGTGAELMQRLAAPMVGGMLTTLLLTLWVLPVVYLLWRKRHLKQHKT